MRKQPKIETQSAPSRSKQLRILSISPSDEDHLSLQAVFSHTKWLFFKARDLATGVELLQEHEIAVLLCERDLLVGTWTDVLEHIQTLQTAPSLIVTSRLADDRLWAEALNLGAWDVLAKPFDRLEVIRSVKSAWQRWQDSVHMRTGAVRTMDAAV